jgi:hypothetical protein
LRCPSCSGKPRATTSEFSWILKDGDKNYQRSEESVSGDDSTVFTGKMKITKELDFVPGTGVQSDGYSTSEFKDGKPIALKDGSVEGLSGPYTGTLDDKGQPKDGTLEASDGSTVVYKNGVKQ